MFFVGLVKMWLWSTGHGFWLSGLQNTIYMIPDDTHPALAAFYMFWTMIIVLQVSDSERKHLISTQTHVHYRSKGWNKLSFVHQGCVYLIKYTEKKQYNCQMF